MAVGLNKHEPLYLKHRPQALAELVGQAAVLKTLKNALEYDRLSHAYLFTGPRGTGKTSTARILAKSLNCENGPTATPCQECTACQEIAAGISPAVFEIDAASNNSVDDARALIERAPLVAVGGRFKLYIIDECHMLTKEAFNALLKTIEEPPPQVVFILATTEEHKVLPTIVSRCQRLMFRLVSQEDLTVYLREIANEEKINIEEEALKVIARRSGGGLRDALGLLDQAGLLSSSSKAVSVNDLLSLLGSVHEDVLLELSKGILEAAGQSVLTAINKLLQEGREPAVLAFELARHFLNLVKASYLAETQEIDANEIKKLVIGSPEYLQALCLQAPSFDRGELVQMVEYLDRLEQSCRRTTQPAMTLEMGLLSLCHRQDIHLVNNLSKRIANLESQIAGGNVSVAAIKDVAIKIPEKVQAVTTNQSVKTEVQSQADKVNLQFNPTSDNEEALKSTPVLVETLEIRTEGSKVDSVVSVELEDMKPPIAELKEMDSLEEANSPKESQVDLDAFWSQLIVQLEERHRPTWSLVSTHAFPVSLEESGLIIGVLRDNFQKMIENKLDHVRIACELVLKRQVAVRVKVMSQQPPASAIAEKDKQNSDNAGKEISGMQIPQPVATVNSVEVRKAPPGPMIAEKPPQVNEAYKLFEGPGSRQIG